MSVYRGIRFITFRTGTKIGFVAEIIQALDKIRFESLTDKSKLDGQPELFIRLVPDKANKTLSIIDSGIGMTKAGEICLPNELSCVLLTIYCGQSVILAVSFGQIL